MERRTLALEIAWELYGLPYKWGGDDPLEGFDCSGDIVEVLKSTGELPHDGDWNSNDLWLRFRRVRVDTPVAGGLVFYGTSSKITHVMMCISATHCIGATGGWSSTTDIEIAADQNAFIKVRPITYRDDIVGFVDPFLDI
jgi:cell wall-associated NlpC family hydrolase